MSTRSARLLLSALVLLGLSAEASFAQDGAEGRAAVTDNESNQTAPNAYDLIEDGADASSGVGFALARDPFRPRMSIDKRIGGPIGQDNGFTNLNLFLPYDVVAEESLVFAEVRALITDEGDGGTNVGLGYRVYVPELDRIFGIHGWWDYDQHIEDYQQVAFGFESLGRYLDFRIDAFIPVGRDSNTLSKGFIGDPQFRQNFIVFTQREVLEVAYRGLRAEIGGPLPLLGRYGIEGFLGGYYIESNDARDAGGVQFRVVGHVTDDFDMRFDVTNDRVFGTRTTLSAVVSLPDGRPTRWFRPKPVREELTAQVERLYRVITDVVGRLDHIPAINPADGQPFLVVHVDPNQATNGTGTFENPLNSILAFDTLPAATKDSFDIVFVRRRTDDTDTNLNTTVTLSDNQRLLSESVLHTFTATQGTFNLPGFNPGALPILSNSGVGGIADVVTLADNNEVSGFVIDGIDGASGDGITGDQITGFNINRNTIRNAQTGIALTNVDGTVAGGTPGLIDANTITANTGDGINITNTLPRNLDVILTGNAIDSNGGVGFAFAANSGVSSLTIGGVLPGDGNAFAGNQAGGIAIDLTSTAVASLNVENNSIFGGVSGGAPVIGLNFTGSTLADSGFIPPDTMGSVGPNHIAELINGRFAVYDKTTGALITSSTLDQFWTNAGVAPPAGNGTFDPRIIYDPASGRWFAASIDGGAGNRIYIAVSQTSDPTGPWTGFNFVGDTIDGTRFNDFDSFGIDADGVYIATNNFGGPSGFDVSVYSIPKADLLAAVPTIANLTRFEALDSTVVGSSLQPAVDFGASDGRAAILAAQFSGGSTLFRTDVLGAGGAGATLSGTTNIATPLAYTPPPDADQPGPKANLDTSENRFGSTVFEQGNSLWAVHTVTDPATGNAAIRWYEIDETTNTVLQSGTISDPNLDFYYPSIAANASGNVVIGFSGSSDTQFVSTYAAVGNTVGGVTNFGNPVLLQAGVSDYEILDGTGRNRWGDYSATVLDPSDPFTFWTFQEFVNGTDSWATQITQISVVSPGTSDGIRVTLRDNARLTASAIRNNAINNNGQGVRIQAFDSSVIENLTFNPNDITGNNAGGVRFEHGGTALITASFNGDDLSNNVGVGLDIFSDGAGGTIDLNLADAIINGNSQNNLRIQTTGGVMIDIDGDRNSFNTAGLSGWSLDIGGTSNVDIALNNTVIDSSGENGIFGTVRNDANLTLTLDSPVDPLFAGRTSISSNTLGGLDITTLNDSVLNLSITAADINANQGAEGLELSLFDASTGNLTLVDSSVSNQAAADGIQLNRADMSLLTGIIRNTNVDSNAGDGLIAELIGSDPLDPSQPNPGQPNTLTIEDSTFSSNTGDGQEYMTDADSVLVVNMARTTIDSNGGNGVLITANNNSGFGNPITATPSIFDAVTITNNGAAGISATANDAAAILLDIIAGSGATSIAGNAGDGVAVSTFSSAEANVDIDGAGGFGTTITGNTGDGVSVTDASSDGTTLTITDTTIGGSSSALGNGGDGVSVLATGLGSPVINVGLAGRPVTIRNNTGDGVAVTVDGTTGGGTGATLAITEADIRDNGAHGVDVQVNGPLDAFNLAYSTIDATISDSTISNNGQRGVSVVMTGEIGDRSDPFLPDLATVTLDSNTISGNQEEGVFYEINPGAVLIDAAGNTHRSVTIPGPAAPPYDPTSPPFLALADYLVPYMNLRTESNSFLTVTNNTIQDNGRGMVTGDGLFIRVATNAYVAADVRDNTFGGNLLADFRTESFITTDAAGNPVNPPDAIDNAGANADIVFLDDTAQLDLRFTGNSGNEVNARNSLGALYTNNDPGKTGFVPPPRPVQLFQVDDGPSLNPTNPFIQFGVLQDVELDFILGGYNVRAAADPLFPSPFFPPFLP